MNRYNVQEQLGDGAFGVVFRAEQKNTGEIVAIKRMKQRFVTWEECLQLREIISLRRLQHPNVIKMKEVVRENAELCMVFEFMEQNIFQIMKQRSTTRGHSPNLFDEREIRSILTQTLLGLSAVHKGGFMHRDLKPENLLTKGDLVKIADFGLAKEIRSRPPFTEYVSTRWYRAPEIVLRSDRYNSPIDVWALGVIAVELYLNRPLFPGASDTDQLFKICSVLGAPTLSEWDEGHQLARRLNLRFPNISPTPLRQLLANTCCSPAALDLFENMLRFNPSDRPTAAQCLQHPFITGSDLSGGFGGATASLFIGIATGNSHNPFHTAIGVPQPMVPSNNGNSNNNDRRDMSGPAPGVQSQGNPFAPQFGQRNSPSPSNSPTPGNPPGVSIGGYPRPLQPTNTNSNSNPVHSTAFSNNGQPPPAPNSPFTQGAQGGYSTQQPQQQAPGAGYQSTFGRGNNQGGYNNGNIGGGGGFNQQQQQQQSSNRTGGGNSMFNNGGGGGGYGGDAYGHNRSQSGNGAHHFGSAGPLDEY